MLPRLLILDDLFGRNLPDGRNSDRENLCAHFLWHDATGDASAQASQQKILQPTAEAVFCRAQSPACSGPGDAVENDLETAMEAVRKGWPVENSKVEFRKSEIPWSLVLIDLCFYTGRVTEDSHRRTPGMPAGRPGDDDPSSYFGLTLLDAIHREFPELPILILSSKPREEVSLEFSRRGALGFIARDDLRGPELLQEALSQHGLLPDSNGLAVGHSLPLLLALREARRAARHGQNVLVRGERGTGKELLARYLHRAASDVPSRPFVAVNSAVFTQTLFASELFGIEPKTASGVDAKIGLIESANGGDLFLDEIADMPAEVQAAVLRVLQERQITRVGGRQAKPVNVRFLSATNAEIELEERGFRADLLDRLRLGGSLWLPPLRERKTDIPLLAETFVRKAEKQRAGTMRRAITSEAFDRLAGYDWPGNIRELSTCLFDAVNRHPDVEHLVPAHLRIGNNTDTGTKAKIPLRKGRAEASSQRTAPSDVSAVVEDLKSCEFPPQTVGVWAGRFDELQIEHTRLLARYLRAALDATRRRTPELPQGQIQIHPAVKLMTGDSSLTASKAADLIKRLLSPLEGELAGDLAEAYATAVRLRPKSARKASTNPGDDA
jgi:DNA-binding NtrC family response regulator